MRPTFPAWRRPEWRDVHRHARAASYTFQFVDTSNAANQAAAGTIPIDFNSVTGTSGTPDTIDTIRGYMVTAINNVLTVLVNADGTPFDGDADGTPGGLYNFWFNVAGVETSGAKDRTIFVNKSAPSGGTGGITAPYTTISAALAAAASDAQAGTARHRPHRGQQHERR